MKILISGHTNGIGQAIYEHFSKNGHIVTGYSRSNSLDLHAESNQRAFADEAVTSDVIIINANISFACVRLLYKVFEKIQGKNKTIVVLGSRRTEILTSKPMLYQIEKIAIEETAKQLQNSAALPHIVILRPGYVDTPATSHITAVKTDPRSVAELLDWILETNRTKDFKILNLLFGPQ